MSYATFTLKQLQDAVEPHTAVETAACGSSGAILATEQGARLLGLFPDKDLPNVLWVHEEVGKQYGEGNWLVGGERLWIAPERTFYYENPRDFEGFHVPADIDPGNYTASSGMIYESAYSLFDLDTNKVYDDTRARRRFAVIADPFATGLPCAAVRIEDSIAVQSTALPFCAWTLAMVYTCGTAAPGTVLFPIRAGGRLLSYFSPIPGERAEVLDGYARFRIDGAAVYKLAIAPEDFVTANACRTVYVSRYPCADTWFCVIKRCAQMPQSQSECVDIPKGDPVGRRGAIQSYNSGPSDLSPVVLPFGELELQLPRAVPDHQRAISRATHELLAYAGSRTQILGLAAEALGLATPPRLYE